MALLRRFGHDRSGNVASTFALSILPLVGLAGAAVDYSRATKLQSNLQQITDAAALSAAAAKASSSDARVNVALGFFRTASSPSQVSHEATASVSGKTVTVTAKDLLKTGILGAIGINEIVVAARSKAERIKQGPPVCVMALSHTASGAVTFAGSSSFVADGCAIHSNSSSGNSLVVQGSASVKAGALCAVGGVSVPSSLAAMAESNCDRLEDPFRNLPEAVATGCDYNKKTVQPGDTETLYGDKTYCNGLDIKGNATLQPGLYIIKNGPLTISSQANVTGAGVTFYLVGQGAGFTFNGSGKIDLSAMTSGPYQGMLIVQDRVSNTGATNTLNGDSTTKLSGAIYTPTQSLTLNSSGTFGQASAFMPIIADQIKFAGSATARSDVNAVKTPAPLPVTWTGARLID